VLHLILDAGPQEESGGAEGPGGGAGMTGPVEAQVLRVILLAHSNTTVREFVAEVQRLEELIRRMSPTELAICLAMVDEAEVTARAEAGVSR